MTSVVFPQDEDLFQQILSWTDERIHTEPNPFYGAKSAEELSKILGGKITSSGLSASESFALFEDGIIPSIRAQHHVRNVSYVPAAPTPASLAMDAAIGAAEIFAGTWESGSGAIFAENEALAWLAKMAGFPETAGGVFVSGGTNGNLSALHAARHKKRQALGDARARLGILCSTEAHSSIDAVAHVMDVDITRLPVDADGCFDIASLSTIDPAQYFAIVANGGATNSGAVDDLAALADFAQSHELWLHVDGAYGLAAIAAPSTHEVFVGLERADSFIVDPHKWLFAPYDCCALVYRNPQEAADAHAQKAVYLDPIRKANWNPTDYAIHLSRRARGLPFWFSLVYYGTDAYAQAIDQTITTTREIAAWMDAKPELDLIVASRLSVILFRPNQMDDDAIDQWAEDNKAAGTILCMPTIWRGQKVLRICIVNPETQSGDIIQALESLIS